MALGRESRAGGKVWMGTGCIDLGALWPCGGREDSWRGLWEQDVVAQGGGLVAAGLQRAMGRAGVGGVSGWVRPCSGPSLGLLSAISIHKNVPDQPGGHGLNGLKVVAEQPVMSADSSQRPSSRVQLLSPVCHPEGQRFWPGMVPCMEGTA